MISDAIAAGRYRDAIHLLYLQTLSQLHQSGAIEWKVDKTNRRYVFETSGTIFQSDFSDWTNYFEYLWYGGFACAKDQLKTAQNMYQKFYRTFTKSHDRKPQI